MTKQLVFDGRVIVHPGGYSRADVSGLNTVGLTPTGVIGVLGEADEGAPNTLHRFDDPQTMREYFAKGALADAAGLLFEPSVDSRVPSGASVVYAIKTNQSKQSELPLVTPFNPVFADDVDSATNGPPTLTAAGDFVNYDLTDLYVRIIAGKGSGQIRRIASNDDNQLTLDVAIPWVTVPDATSRYEIVVPMVYLISDKYGLPANELSAEFGAGSGAGTFMLQLNNGIDTLQSEDLGGEADPVMTLKMDPQNVIAVDATETTTAAASSLLTFGAGTFLANAYANRIIKITGPDTDPAYGQIRRVAATHLADQLPVTAPFSPAPAAGGGQTVEIYDCTDIRMRVAGTKGKATSLVIDYITSAPATVTYRTIDLVTEAENLAQLRAVLESTPGFDSGDGYVEVGRRNAKSTLTSRFDYGAWSNNWNASIDVAFVIRDDVSQIVEFVNASSGDFTARRFDSPGAAGVAFDSTGIIGGVAPEDNGGVFKFLFNGQKGESTSTNWSDAFNEMLKEKRIFIGPVPLISDDEAYTGGTVYWDVIAQLAASHVNLASTTEKCERNGYLGANKPLRGTTGLLKAIRTLNNRNLTLVGQKIEVLDSQNEIVELPEWAFACECAGIQGGTDIGEPLTFKLIKSSAISQNSDWDPADRKDVREALLGGLTFVEDSEGFYRIVRGLTTYVQDDNLALTDINVNEVRNYTSKDLRDLLEKRFTGTKGLPATIASVRDTAATRLELYRTNEIIVDSLDENGEQRHAWYNLRVMLEGDVVRLRTRMFPVTGINFILNELFLALPRIAA